MKGWGGRSEANTPTHELGSAQAERHLYPAIGRVIKWQSVCVWSKQSRTLLQTGQETAAWSASSPAWLLECSLVGGVQH